MDKIAKFIHLLLFSFLTFGSFFVLRGTAAGDIAARIPKTSAISDSTCSLPVLLQGDVAGSGVVSAQVTLAYAPHVLEATGVRAWRGGLGAFCVSWWGRGR